MPVQPQSGSFSPHRRAALLLLGAIGLASRGAYAAGPSAAQPAPPAQPVPGRGGALAGAGEFETFLKLRASLDERPVYQWLLGHRYLMLNDGSSYPLCQMSNCSIARTRRKGAGAFELTLVEYNYNTDFDSGEWRDTLRMPVTGREVAVPQGRAEPVRHEWRRQYAFEGRLADSHEFPPSTHERFGADAQLTIDRKLYRPERLGDEIAFTQDWYLRVAPRQAGRKGWWVRELSTVRGDARQALDPRQMCIPARTSYSIAYDFHPWMQLDGVPGHVLTTAVGGKAQHADELPGAIRRIMSQRDPGSLGDPRALLGD